MTFGRFLGGLLVALVLQVLLGRWEVAARVVDPFLALAVVSGLNLQRAPSLFAGLTAGLVRDSWWSAWFGLHGFSKTVVAYAASALGARLDLAQPVPRVLALGLASAADRALQFALGAAMGRAVHAGSWGEWLLGALATVIMGLMAFAVLDRLRTAG